MDRADLKKYEYLDAANPIPFSSHQELLDGCFGCHGNLIRAVQDINSKCRVWMPKFLTYASSGKPRPASSGWINEFSSSGDLIITTKPSEDPFDIHFPLDHITLVFGKAGDHGPYTFRGAYVEDQRSNTENKFCFRRIATKVRLIGNPVRSIELLDEDRSAFIPPIQVDPVVANRSPLPQVGSFEVRAENLVAREIDAE